MSTTLHPIQEYLVTSYHPDCEYVDGTLLDRNVGEKDHSKLQARLIGLFLNRPDLHVFPEQRVQVSPTRYRVPDVCLVAGPEPDEQVFTTPPFAFIEILSKDDRMAEMQDRLQDYVSMGVPNVWLLDPKTQKAYRADASGVHRVEGRLATARPDVFLDLTALFRN